MAPSVTRSARGWEKGGFVSYGGVRGYLMQCSKIHRVYKAKLKDADSVICQQRETEAKQALSVMVENGNSTHATSKFSYEFDNEPSLSYRSNWFSRGKPGHGS